MTFAEQRNTLVSALSEALHVPVLLSDQVQPEVEFPFIVYSVTAPYISSGERGDYEWEQIQDNGEDFIIDHRREQATATYSFTACSINRWADSDQTEYIFGDDEAVELAQRAMSYLQEGGYNDLSNRGLVVVSIANVGNRSTLVIDEAARRYGFDVTIRYTKEDTRRDNTIERVTIIRRES